MAVKHLNKKNARQKKMIQSIAVTKNEGVGSSFDLNTVEGREAAIIRQFNQIQKDYVRLMTDVVKELDLVRGWIGTQAIHKRDEIRTLLNTRLSRN